ncbi:wobble nucleotide-excising tRNase [Dyadobacter sp. BE34]|uniref:Wobble nucleotide-excising tRNase n=1 Tax=Dyadobacter fermentans TaxID=94254 RepID=A0ABU1QQM5_9BACT|nr:MULTISPECIES: AAA family ATPase [Dyadobacter]MDR6803431.1 wobble nucleotide-excising tRNase [Dyadobacter fermentans]MDR7041172.1 wobble nucleotide-excising tRNase [Dyadobacter sp. BE242]MDR7195575.1 wobble nucleotide-excising tRNase [Dyadobacter sp. BE34]MDR7213880.1 wobble nucleotide-excising tRNase [Dyadobacter sp. BE31]MDR7260982.1 wobble nucleotide-excising tRNase [Dyadobacter sp. BE32]
MIGKVKVHKVASFKNPTILESDKKVNLIYGLNGTGKSTISNLFYKSNHSDFKDCSIEGIEDVDVLVYNQTFIQDNFFETENINGIFTLSQANKEAEIEIAKSEQTLQSLQQQKASIGARISELRSDLETKINNAKTKIWEIKTKYSGGDRVLEFCLEGLKSDGTRLLNYLESIPKSETRPTLTIEAIKEEANSLIGEQAQKYPKLDPIKQVPENLENNPIFKKQIVGNKNSSVSEFISKLNNSDWILSGLTYLSNSVDSENQQCPFCQQETISTALISDIRNYFDEAYEMDVNSLKTALNEYICLTTSVLNKAPFDNPKCDNFRKDIESHFSDLTKTTTENIRLIEYKIQSPSQPINLTPIKSILNELASIVSTTNQLIEEHNDKIDSKGKAVANLKSIFWQINRWDYDQTLSNLSLDRNAFGQKLIEAEQTIESINKEIIFHKTNISNQQKKTINIDQAITSINNSLLDLGIDGFSIVKHSDVLYKIKRQESDSKIFHSLSEGEKMIISFLYFLELCRGRRNSTSLARKKIVVIDDPISSLSHIYVFNIGRLIMNEFMSSNKYEQIFILTHSLYFFYELTDTKKERRDVNQKLFRLRKNENGSEILIMKYEEIQNDYQSYWHIVNDKDQPPALIANCMRNIIEYFYNFVEKSDLNVVFQKKEMQEAKFQAFNRYINRESHSLGQNIFDIKEFDYDHFREAFATMFKICGYEDHYKKMAK